MLAPDNHIQDPYNSMSYDRFGYVWNNPLGAVDPSGEELLTVLAIIGKAMAAYTAVRTVNGYITGYYTGAKAALSAALRVFAAFSGFGEAVGSTLFSSAANSTAGIMAQAAVAAGVSEFILGFTDNLIQTGDVGYSMGAAARGAGVAAGMAAALAGLQVRAQKRASRIKAATSKGHQLDTASKVSGSAINQKQSGIATQSASVYGETIIWGDISMEEFMALYGEGTASGSNSGWFGYANNATALAAFVVYRSGGSLRIAKGGRLSPKYYASGWKGGSLAKIKTYDLGRLGTRLGTVSLGAGIFEAGYQFYSSDRSWGDYGKLGVSTLSTGLTITPEPFTTVIGLGIGFTDAAGGFNGFYSYLDTSQAFFQTNGQFYIPY